MKATWLAIELQVALMFFLFMVEKAK